MVYKAETAVPREILAEIKYLISVAEKVPPEKLYGFFQFIRGIEYGLDIADRATWTERHGT